MCSKSKQLSTSEEKTRTNSSAFHSWKRSAWLPDKVCFIASGGSKGWVGDTHLPLSPISLIFMQFPAKMMPNNRLAPSLMGSVPFYWSGKSLDCCRQASLLYDIPFQDSSWWSGRRWAWTTTQTGSTGTRTRVSPRFLGTSPPRPGRCSSSTTRSTTCPPGPSPTCAGARTSVCGAVSLPRSVQVCGSDSRLWRRSIYPRTW